MPRISSRGREVAEYIRDRKAFTTSGALKATVHGERGAHEGSGHLNAEEQKRFYAESSSIRYIVWSYATPIAWWSEEHGWRIVDQRFSVTTSKHQGLLYLIDRSAA
jgi:hypothetical protein